MSRILDLVRVAAAGLTARKVRTFLILLGPILGVGAIVSAIGINESSKGYLKAVSYTHLTLPTKRIV